MSKRDEGKANRRSKIVEAARSIIIERGDDGFAMRDLAARSGSSLGTVYSLYGAKQNVIADLLNSEAEAMVTAMASRSSSHCLGRLFFIVDETYRRHASLEQYLIYILRMSYGQSASDRFVDMRDAYFRATIDEAIAAGELKARLSAGHVARALSVTYTGALLDYSMGRISLTQFTTDCGLGFALTLSAAASEAMAAYIDAKIEHYASTDVDPKESGSL